jgi:hypothetical protein
LQQFIKTDYTVFLKGFGSQIIVNDHYFGVVFDLLINLIFSVDINNIKESIKIFGVR